MPFYNNLPQEKKAPDSSAATLKIFDAYATSPLNFDAATYDAIVGFFNKRGFSQDSSESMTYIILKQAVLDNINPFTLIDQLKGLENVQLSALVAEIINYNRFKTSSLGTASKFTTLAEVARNIIA